MPLDWSTFYVVAVIFLATLIRSAFGFGEALVAVPLLALVLPVEVAVPLSVLFSVTVAVIVLAQDWHQVHVQSAWRLILSTLPGIPLGLLLLTRVPESIVKAGLGVFIIAFSIYCLTWIGRFELKSERSAWFFGFLAGVLGGAYGMNGPPLVVYGTLRRWSPEQVRATLQGYFLPASLVGLVGYWQAGVLTHAVGRSFVICFVPGVVAIFLGRLVNRSMNPRHFILCVYGGLIILGGILLIQALS